jgi:hypothetical protein
LANTAEQALQQNVTLEFLQFPFGGFDEYMLELDNLLDLNPQEFASIPTEAK